MSSVYFIYFCEVFAMKLNVSEEITSVDLNNKTISSFQKLKLYIANKRGQINFDYCTT